MMRIWKIAFSRDSAKKDTVENLHYCLSHSIVAVTLEADRSDWSKSIDWEELELFEEYKDYPSEVYAIFSQIRAQDLVWARDHLGVYFLGRVLETTLFRFRKGGRIPDHLQYPCRWFRIGTAETISQVIIDSFSPYRKIKFIGGGEVNTYSRLIYNGQIDDFYYPITELESGNLFDRFGTDEFLDIISLYLQQSHDCRVVPSSLTKDTGILDFTVMIGNNGKTGGVKLHLDAKPLDLESFSSFHGQVFLFSPNADVVGIRPPYLHVISSKELESYLFGNMLSLPFSISNWVRHYLQNLGFGDIE